MAEDWSINVRQYAPNADAAVIAGIVQYCGVALHSRNEAHESMVILADKQDVEHIRAHFLKRRLDLSLSDDELDNVITAVCTRMGEDRDKKKNRVTVYYLLAEHFDKLALFKKPAHHGGLCGTLARCGWRHCGLFWLVLLLILLVLLGLYFGWHHHKQRLTASVTHPLPSAVVTTPTTIPSGAGVMREMHAGKPMVVVYFDTGKAEISPDFAASAALLKSFLNAHPDSTLAISGYNDQTGSQEANAELSKERAKAIQAALVATGIPETSISLLKPIDPTDTSTTNAQARRVEIRAQ